ncbi:hypothetical protein GH5_07640 [Leishmania sp. Ghana 2012 LV757]|uniref:hypothetical protein n=1 Tax=Leishmania sp. Ghana 2012 LV757 TaxID=2803181 RepID=UPI001B54DE1D|nr:hypothetical protein GH5_07640 [Leishmania sp. Ghana 2012 LV757]
MWKPSTRGQRASVMRRRPHSLVETRNPPLGETSPALLVSALDSMPPRVLSPCLNGRVWRTAKDAGSHMGMGLHLRKEALEAEPEASIS